MKPKTFLKQTKDWQLNATSTYLKPAPAGFLLPGPMLITRLGDSEIRVIRENRGMTPKDHTFEVKPTVDGQFAVFVDLVRIAAHALEDDAQAHCARLMPQAAEQPESRG